MIIQRQITKLGFFGENDDSQQLLVFDGVSGDAEDTRMRFGRYSKFLLAFWESLDATFSSMRMRSARDSPQLVPVSHLIAPTKKDSAIFSQRSFSPPSHLVEPPDASSMYAKPSDS